MVSGRVTRQKFDDAEDRTVVDSNARLLPSRVGLVIAVDRKPVFQSNPPPIRPALGWALVLADKLVCQDQGYRAVWRASSSPGGGDPRPFARHPCTTPRQRIALRSSQEWIGPLNVTIPSRTVT